MKYLILLLMFLAGCSGTGLPTYVKVDSLRVLTLVASQPEVNAGDTLTITPVVADINGAGRTLTYFSEACLDPGVAVGAEPVCTGAPTRVTLASGTITSLGSPDYTGFANSFTVTVPSSSIIFSGKSTTSQFNGVSYLVVYLLQSSDGAQVKAFKRIVVSTRGTKNTNPVLNDILADGSTLNTVPSKTVLVSANFSTSSSESYQSINGFGQTVTSTESLVTTWFITDGDVKYFRTIESEVTDFSPPSTRPSSGRNVQIIAVMRDGRGGVAVKMKAL